MTGPAVDETISSVSIEGGMVVIRMPMGRAHGLRVALAECPCRAPKSNATRDIRQSLSAALGRLGLTPS